MRWAGSLQQGVEALEGDRKVRAALGPADGVHFVKDHRLDAGKGLAPLRSAAGRGFRVW
jgi:hypothetical protein